MWICWCAASQMTVPISSSRDYISHGLRSRATDLVSAELGPRCEHEIRFALAREVAAERWTRLDAAIRMAADDIGFIDLRSDNPGERDPQVRRLAVGRLRKLERMGLATAAGPGQRMIGLEAEPVLRDLGIGATSSRHMHRAFTAFADAQPAGGIVEDVGDIIGIRILAIDSLNLPYPWRISASTAKPLSRSQCASVANDQIVS
jgi:type IV secretory pathway VirD2 relaxase